MSWTHDTGYGPAYEHVGYPASILRDGTDTSATSAQINPHVVGWRAACECGWRGPQFYSRAEWPSPTGGPPRPVDGWEHVGGTFAEWNDHVARVLPGLAVHDLARIHSAITDQLADAVRTARRAGLSWSAIGRAAGVRPDRAEERWGDAAALPVQQHRTERSRGRDGDAPSR